jgi:hypothetical protein
LRRLAEPEAEEMLAWSQDFGTLQPILFEVADFALCLQLFKRLEGTWPVRLVGRTEARFVAVDVKPGDDERLEELLDTVAHWAAEVGLHSVRYHVGDTMSEVFATD